MIISGGENISSIEIEQVLSEHPAVSEVAVVAIPDEKWGERPKAFVELKSGQERQRGRAASRSAGRTWPSSSARPRSSSASCRAPRTGKMQKFVLREREWAGREKAIG